MATTTIRREQPDDIETVHEINWLAFEEGPEAVLVDTLRSSCPEALSLVAESEGRLVGHILFTPAVLEAGAESIAGMALAPMAVHPDHQRQGVGTRLVNEGLKILAEQQCPYVIVVGHPEYYPRFGFTPADDEGLHCQWEGVPREAFMVKVMQPEVLQGKSGVARYLPEFDAAM